MNWWKTRKARKDLEKWGFDGNYLKNIEKELKQGRKSAEEVRDYMRAQESPQYGQVIEKLNHIYTNKMPIEQKKQISIDLIKSANKIADWEREDLLQQIDRIFRA